MSDVKKETESEETWQKYFKYIISAFVSVTHVIAFFQIVICSRHLAVAFNIPAKNIGIYFAKLYSLRSLLMSMGCAIEYAIFRATSSKDVRKYFSMVWFVLLTICEVSFLIVLYSSKNVAYYNYIVLNLEGMLFGFFQMSIISLIPEFASYYMVSLYVSGTCIFIIQTIIDKCTKNSMLSVKIQSWICVLCSLICVGLWPVRLFVLKDTQQTTTNPCTSERGGQTTEAASAAASVSPGGGDGGSGSSISPEAPAPDTPKSRMAYVMSLSSVSVLKIMTTKLDELCKSLNSQDIVNVQILVRRLEQIRSENEITYEVLVAIDLVILNLKKCSCPSGELILLAELSVFLRIKLMVKTEESEVVEVSHDHRGNNGYRGLPVTNLLNIYPGYQYPYIRTQESIVRAKRSASGEQQTLRRTRRSETPPKTTKTQGSGKAFHEQLLESLSQLMMFPVGSLVKDFLFPGVIPYGLLERDKCHLINLIVIIFLSIGPVTIFIMQQTIGKKFTCDNQWIHMCWNFMIPKIVILIISLCAIHTKQGCTHQIRSSQPIVLFMTVVLLTCYGFLETMSFVGMAHYVKFIEAGKYPDLQAIQNVFGKFFRYFVYKLSVGYNKTRIGAGLVLPNFKPPEPIPNTCGFWFSGAFSNGWKDIVGDFRMGIKQYLSVS